MPAAALEAIVKARTRARAGRMLIRATLVRARPDTGFRWLGDYGIRRIPNHRYPALELERVLAPREPGSRIARAGRILVYDFAATAADLPDWSDASNAAAGAGAATTDPGDLAAGHKLGADVAKELSKKISAMGSIGKTGGVLVRRPSMDVMSKSRGAPMAGHEDETRDTLATRRHAGAAIHAVEPS
jgi:hypothetical protein